MRRGRTFCEADLAKRRMRSKLFARAALFLLLKKGGITMSFEEVLSKERRIEEMINVGYNKSFDELCGTSKVNGRNIGEKVYNYGWCMFNHGFHKSLVNQ